MTSRALEFAAHDVPGYVVRRWRRYGHDRLYVSVEGAPDGVQLGFRDLATGSDHPTDPGDLDAACTLTRVADAWCGEGATAEAALPTPVPSEDPRAPAGDLPAPWTDLTHARPGSGVAAQGAAERAAAPVRTVVARVLGVHTEERSWRVGARGEQLVGVQLAKLARVDARWTAIHSIPVGRRGSDIDHLVMGPGGVFTLNTKHHPDAEVWAGGETFMVNGARVPYVRNARHEAERAERLLTAAVGRRVPVTGIVVPVGCTLVVKSQPRGVHVIGRRDLVSWLRRLGPVLTDADLAPVWEAARRSTTWTG